MNKDINDETEKTLKIALKRLSFLMASDANPEQIKAINESIKILGELSVTYKVLNE